QAGLSWSTIINREENYRAAFDGFDPQIVASYDAEKIEELMRNEGIIRNRRKIEAAVLNARAFLEVQKEFGSFDRYIWSFTNGEAIDHHLTRLEDMPATSELSEKVSKDLKKRGFRFVGPTIIYSYMQGIGIYNDHLVGCDYR
ncbi:MAG: DNA-3-methyladenine glycosylase I, partial [Lachnospiraceae bacterium]|nr:DNA-3-methyladenine glycosylase I [Lachnospiraceae bacterium]